MKKLLLVILALTLVFGLGACNTASTEDYATKSELELLELEIQAIQERIDNLVVIHGLNGQVSIYENEALKEELNLKLVTLSLKYSKSSRLYLKSTVPFTNEFAVCKIMFRSCIFVRV